MLKRRKVKVKDKYGAYRTHEDDIRESFDADDAKYREDYNKFSAKEKSKISLSEELEKVRENSKKMADTISIDDMDMLTKTSKDKDYNLSEFIMVLKNIHPNLVLIPNNLLGENVGGHAIFFQHQGELLFVCGVGKNLDKTIRPETTFRDYFDVEKNDKERKVLSKGYLPAFEVLYSWLENRGIRVRKDIIK